MAHSATLVELVDRGCRRCDRVYRIKVAGAARDLIHVFGRRGCEGEMVRHLLSGVRSLAARLRRDGPVRTWWWVQGHAWPCLSGIPCAWSIRVTDGLYVGPQIGRAGLRRLRRLGVGASVNLRVEFDDVAGGVAFPEHLRLPTRDGEAPPLEHLALGVEFIARVLAAGGRVYVHCRTGVGRAPTLAVAYLVSTGWDPAAAVARVQAARPFVRLTPPQVDQLARFAAWWAAERNGATGPRPNNPL